MGSIHFKKSGFTLIEILIVIAIMAMLFVFSARGFVNSKGSFLFINTSQQLVASVREARSYAIAGKAQLDYTDYDRDGFNATTSPPDGPDYVAPAHYGIHFDLTAKKILLFADIHSNSETGTPVEGVFEPPNTPVGTYQAGKDLILSVYTLPDAYHLIIKENASNIFYSPVLADTRFDGGAINSALHFGIAEVDGSRIKCFSIHVVSGIPEEVDSAECL